MKVRRALISVYDKKGIVEFARGLWRMGVEVISTGGTAKLLRSKGVEVREVSEVTGFPEIFSGRVKTLHPLIHGGILFRRDLPEHKKEAEKMGILPIDMVVVNLYPFREVVSKDSVTLEEALENIDIGGPTLLRASAKNFPQVIVLVDPEDYSKVLEVLRKGKDLTLEERRELARKAFFHTAAYDIAISKYFLSFDKDTLPEYLLLEIPRNKVLRYGENSHQKAGFYSLNSPWEVIQGKEISYNNLLDMDAAVRVLKDFTSPTAVVIKHTNPSGVATHKDITQAYIRARDADPVSAFGSVVGVNREVDEQLAREIASTFVEVIVAPSFKNSALKVFSQKPALRVVKWNNGGEEWEMRSIEGGVLLQDRDNIEEDTSSWRVVSKKTPDEKELQDLIFAWKVVKHVKSNAIVIARDSATAGIGAGQMSRIDAVRIALQKSGGKERGAVLASDAFFPFSDSIEEAARAGITAIVEPGGAKRDEECIKKADEYGIALVFTGKRHFRH